MVVVPFPPVPLVMKGTASNSRNSVESVPIKDQTLLVSRKGWSLLGSQIFAKAVGKHTMVSFARGPVARLP